MFAALRAGQVNAAWTSTADPDIPADLVVLADGTGTDPGRERGAAVSPQRAAESQLLALNEVAGVLDTAALVEMRRQVAAGADPGEVADRGWPSTRWANSRR